MTGSLCLLTSDQLKQLAGALRSERLVPPYTLLSMKRYVSESLAGRVAADLQQRFVEGMEPSHLAACIELLCLDRLQRPVAEDLIDLVWTGPESLGILNRDTGVVVRELFKHARESVMVVGYAVYQGHMVFKTLAERMEQNPQLSVRMFLDIQRDPDEHLSPSEQVRRYAERFKQKQWPGDRLPSLYYDPRSLATDNAQRASLHAKCIVVDKEHAFVSSANFTEAAQTKNIEVGVTFCFPAFACKLVEHFEALASAGILRPIPLG